MRGMQFIGFGRLTVSKEKLWEVIGCSIMSIFIDNFRRTGVKFLPSYKTEDWSLVSAPESDSGKEILVLTFYKLFGRV
jgi:hypothetical protein